MYLSFCVYISKSVLQGEQKYLILVDSTLLGHIDCMSKGSTVVAVHLTLQEARMFVQAILPNLPKKMVRWKNMTQNTPTDCTALLYYIFHLLPACPREAEKLLYEA